MGNRDGAVVRALASHQFGLGSIPGPGVICGLSLLLVLVLAPRVFPGSPVFLLPQKPTFPNSNWNQWTKSHSVEMPLQNCKIFIYLFFVYLFAANQYKAKV